MTTALTCSRATRSTYEHTYTFMSVYVFVCVCVCARAHAFSMHIEQITTATD